MRPVFGEYYTLPNSIRSHNSKDNCLLEFRQVFGSQKAKDAKIVLYVFVCKKKIPRVKSKSDIVYIGQTRQTLYKRYMKYADTFCSGVNSPLYRYILTHYGRIKIAYKHFHTAKSLKQAETELLNDYYRRYKEYPPRNFQRW
jgi:hypothetical protein